MGAKSDFDNELERTIFEYIQEMHGVTFVELQRRFGKGEYRIWFPNLNIVLWAGMKKKVCDAVGVLREKKLIKYRVCEALIYFIDGGGLRLPIAIKAPPSQGFPCLCWLPVIIEPVSKEGKRE